MKKGHGRHRKTHNCLLKNQIIMKIKAMKAVPICSNNILLMHSGGIFLLPTDAYIPYERRSGADISSRTSSQVGS